MVHANFTIESETDDCLAIRDIGPWNSRPTITNDAEYVVSVLADRLNGRRLEYYDSEGNLDQIIVRDGKFWGFAPVDA